MRLALALLLTGCSGAMVAVDAGTDAGPDAGQDAGVDAGTKLDAGVDAGPDGDAGVDAGPGMDAGTDAGTDGGLDDGGTDDGGTDAGVLCAPYGAPGVCESTADCSAMASHTSVAGYCPGPANIECCIVTPNTANNPPTPAGWRLMMQSEVTSAMTQWAVAILNDPVTYPMFSMTMMTFGTFSDGGPGLVMAIVEWHPPDFQNSVVHRGVTLYEPI
jgi:hypothetical protein